MTAQSTSPTVPPTRKGEKGKIKENILRELPVNKIARYFTEGFGRPTKELDRELIDRPQSPVSLI